MHLAMVGRQRPISQIGTTPVGRPSLSRQNVAHPASLRSFVIPTSNAGPIDRPPQKSTRTVPIVGSPRSSVVTKLCQLPESYLRSEHILTNYENRLPRHIDGSFQLNLIQR